MSRQTTLGLSASVTTLLCGAVLALTAAPAAAAPATCRTMLTGGLVGSEVIASSQGVLAEAAPRRQIVQIDQVTVNYFGETRYRLAAPIALVDVRTPGQPSFTGGAGAYVSTAHLSLNKRFLDCVSRRLG
jgi:xanthosine utilization system XapX-like protein